MSIIERNPPNYNEGSSPRKGGRSVKSKLSYKGKTLKHALPSHESNTVLQILQSRGIEKTGPCGAESMITASLSDQIIEYTSCNVQDYKLELKCLGQGTNLYDGKRPEHAITNVSATSRTMYRNLVHAAMRGLKARTCIHSGQHATSDYVQVSRRGSELKAKARAPGRAEDLSLFWTKSNILQLL